MEDTKTHNSYHIENITDLRVYKKEAEERRKKGGVTNIHLHAHATDCKGQMHIIYNESGISEKEESW